MSVKVKYSHPTRHQVAQFFDWEQYCDGDTHHLKRGEDWFGDRIDSARSAGQQWAARQGGSNLEGMKATTSIVDADTFSFRIIAGLPKWLAPEALALQKLRQDGNQHEFDDRLGQVKRRLDAEREQRRAAAGFGKPEGATRNADPTLARRRKLAEKLANEPQPERDPIEVRRQRMAQELAAGNVQAERDAVAARKTRRRRV